MSGHHPAGREATDPMETLLAVGLGVAVLVLIVVKYGLLTRAAERRARRPRPPRR